MFCVDEATAESIRRALVEDGDLFAIVEFRRHFPLITDHGKALECARIIAGWGAARPPAAAREDDGSRKNNVVRLKPKRRAKA